jgi:hypothetical protein
MDVRAGVSNGIDVAPGMAGTGLGIRHRVTDYSGIHYFLTPKPLNRQHALDKGLYSLASSQDISQLCNP